MVLAPQGVLWAVSPARHSLQGTRRCRGNPQPHSPALDHSRSSKHMCFTAIKHGEAAMVGLEACLRCVVCYSWTKDEYPLL